MESWPVSEVASPPQGPLSPGDKASSYDNTKPQPEASPPGGNSKTQPSTVSHLLLTFKKYLLRSFYACLYQRSEGPELGGEIKGEKSKIEKLASTYLIWRETKKKKKGVASRSLAGSAGRSSSHRTGPGRSTPATRCPRVLVKLLQTL